MIADLFTEWQDSIRTHPWWADSGTSKKCADNSCQEYSYAGEWTKNQKCLKSLLCSSGSLLYWPLQPIVSALIQSCFKIIRLPLTRRKARVLYLPSFMLSIFCAKMDATIMPSPVHWKRDASRTLKHSGIRKLILNTLPQKCSLMTLNFD